MLFRDISIYCENHMKYVSILVDRVQSFNVKHAVHIATSVI
jgi:hypothetical protein